MYGEPPIGQSALPQKLAIGLHKNYRDLQAVPMATKTPFTGLDEIGSSSYLEQSARFLCLQMYSVQKRLPKDCSACMDFVQ